MIILNYSTKKIVKFYNLARRVKHLFNFKHLQNCFISNKNLDFLYKFGVNKELIKRNKKMNLFADDLLKIREGKMRIRKANTSL